MYSIIAYLRPDCSERIKKAFLEKGFILYYVNHVTGEMTRVNSEKTIFLLNGDFASMYAIINLTSYPDSEIHALIQDPEVTRRKIED